MCQVQMLTQDTEVITRKGS